MRNNIDEIYGKIQNKEYINNGILKDIVILDGAIVQDKDSKYKTKVLNDIEKKYKEKLNGRLYFKIKGVVGSKDTADDKEKEINALLGNLKIWLIRLACLDSFDSDSIEKKFKNIENEKDIEKVYDILDSIDSELLKCIK